MIATDLLPDLGISYRQFDHWCRKGYVPGSASRLNRGSGRPRDLNREQVKHLRIMARIVRDGLRPDAADRLAYELRNGRPVKVGGYTLDPELFYVPGKGENWEEPQYAAQRAIVEGICGNCPSVAECLADALEDGDNDAYRGNTTPVERKQMRRAATPAPRRRSQWLADSASPGRPSSGSSTEGTGHDSPRAP